MNLLGHDIAVSLVDDAFVFAEKGLSKPLVLPAYLAVQAGTDRILAVGQEALDMLHRTPENIQVVRVLKEGRIAGDDVASAFLRYGMKKLVGTNGLLRPRVILAARSEGNAKWEVQEMARHGGAREVFLIEMGMSTALGMGLDVKKPEVRAVLTVSDDWFDYSVVSLGGTLASVNGAVGTRAFVEDIQNHCALARQFCPVASEVESQLMAGALDAGAAGSVSGWEVWAGRSELGRFGAKALAKGDITVGMMPSLVRMTERIKRTIRGLTNDEQYQLSMSVVQATGSAMRIPGLAEAVAGQLGYAVKVFQSEVHASIEGARLVLKELDFLCRTKMPRRVDIS